MSTKTSHNIMYHSFKIAKTMQIQGFECTFFRDLHSSMGGSTHAVFKSDSIVIFISHQK
jgi:hypothetical protein